MENQFSNIEVNSRQSFAEFVLKLKNDLLLNPEDWENKTLVDFLEGMSAYAEDIQGYYENQDQAVNSDLPTWQVLPIF